MPNFCIPFFLIKQIQQISKYILFVIKIIQVQNLFRNMAVSGEQQILVPYEEG